MSQVARLRVPRGWANKMLGRGRGVQYVHCVMPKCIMVKLGGNENEKHRKCVKTRTFYQIRGKSVKAGGK